MSKDTPKLKTSSPKEAENPQLDDLMIAMDIVDTLRHDRLLVERELDDEKKRSELIDRLREIYKSQGIEVPDHILEEGVNALKEDRFTYSPPKDSLEIKLARLYVSREQWGRYALSALAGLILTLGGWYFTVERPRQAKAYKAHTELTRQIPSELKETMQQIGKLASNREDKTRAEHIMQQGLQAALDGNPEQARRWRNDLLDMRKELQRAYRIRIVTRKGELSGLWRIPKTNREARNFYLVVEAVDDQGRILERKILNEETGKHESVRKWAVRVPRSVLVSVQSDKQDDGIIQNAIVANKQTGKLQPQWQIKRLNGAITRW